MIKETTSFPYPRFDLSKDEVKMVMTKMHSTLDRNPMRVVPDTPRDRVKMDLDTCPYPDEERRSRCRKSSPYRTIDGSCNNLKHPLWGRSMTPLTRFLDPDYCDSELTILRYFFLRIIFATLDPLDEFTRKGIIKTCII